MVFGLSFELSGNYFEKKLIAVALWVCKTLQKRFLKTFVSCTFIYLFKSKSKIKIMSHNICIVFQIIYSHPHWTYWCYWLENILRPFLRPFLFSYSKNVYKNYNSNFWSIINDSMISKQPSYMIFISLNFCFMYLSLLSLF